MVKTAFLLFTSINSNENSKLSSGIDIPTFLTMRSLLHLIFLQVAWSIESVVTTGARLIMSENITIKTDPQSGSDFPIGELSKLTGCNIETIRYYEKIDILKTPRRTSSGRRIYNKDEMKRLLFVRRCRELGFTLDEVRELLRLVDGEEYTCDEVKNITINHADEVQTKIKDLRKIEKVLRSMATKCEGRDVPDCPIVDVLFTI